MFSHIMVGSNDIARSKKFYDALFVAMGGQPGTEDARGRLAYAHNGGGVLGPKPLDGEPAAHAHRGHTPASKGGPPPGHPPRTTGVASGGAERSGARRGGPTRP